MVSFFKIMLLKLPFFVKNLYFINSYFKVRIQKSFYTCLTHIIIVIVYLTLHFVSIYLIDFQSSTDSPSNFEFWP